MRNDSGQTYSTDISGHRQIRLLPLKENGMTSPHKNLYENASKASYYHRRHLVVDGTSSSTPPRRRRHLVVDGTSSSTAPRRRRHLVFDGSPSSPHSSYG